MEWPQGQFHRHGDDGADVVNDVDGSVLQVIDAWQDDEKVG
jgi:hypothetical protein